MFFFYICDNNIKIKINNLARYYNILSQLTNKYLCEGKNNLIIYTDNFIFKIIYFYILCNFIHKF